MCMNDCVSVFMCVCVCVCACTCVHLRVCVCCARTLSDHNICTDDRCGCIVLLAPSLVLTAKVATPSTFMILQHLWKIWASNNVAEQRFLMPMPRHCFDPTPIHAMLELCDSYYPPSCVYKYIRMFGTGWTPVKKCITVSRYRPGIDRIGYWKI